MGIQVKNAFCTFMVNCNLYTKKKIYVYNIKK